MHQSKEFYVFLESGRFDDKYDKFLEFLATDPKTSTVLHRA